MESLLPEADLRQEFARRRKRQWLVVIPGVVGIFVMRSGGSGNGSVFGLPATTVVIAGFAIILAATAFSLYNWRCPACSRYLGRAINPRGCQKCGFKLRA